MPFDPTSPITGATVTGLTSPTYTLSSDTPPDSNMEQWAITALGGTQTGVDAHSIAKPFTLTVQRPKSFKALGAVNPVTGQLGSVPENVFKIRVRKGATPLDGQPSRVARCEVVIHVPAGTDVADPEDLRAMLSCFIGALNSNSADISDMIINGII